MSTEYVVLRKTDLIVNFAPAVVKLYSQTALPPPPPTNMLVLLDFYKRRCSTKSEM